MSNQLKSRENITLVCLSLQDHEHPPCRAQREMNIMKASAEDTAVLLINP